MLVRTNKWLIADVYAYNVDDLLHHLDELILGTVICATIRQVSEHDDRGPTAVLVRDKGLRGLGKLCV